MPRIDFFEEHNKQTTFTKVFGLCDDDNNEPAYIDEDLSNKDDKWCGIVYNGKGENVAFYPVDKCVKIKREDGKDASRCDGILSYSTNSLIFTEMKGRKIRSKDWRKKGEKQLLTTIRYFYANYDKSAYNIKAWICNQMDQIVNQDFSTQMEHFKILTKEEFGLGINLIIKREIDIEKI